MLYPKIPLAQSVLEIFKNKGIQNIVISPGSRNAPLTIGFSNNPFFNCYSIVDERCAAFFALGIAQQKREPVAMLCTSGSALLNYYPAVAEAFYSQIPLIVVSADRPHNKIDIGDGQTIRQENVYANHILYNANLQEEASDVNDTEICEAIDTAFLKRGPVHINVPFEEPLYDTVETLTVTPHFSKRTEEKKTFELTEEISSIWNKSAKKLVLVGELFPDSLESKIVEWLAKDNSVVVFTEKTSNLHHPAFVSNIDTIITPFTEEDFLKFQPELLLTFGGMVVSKRIKAFLRKYQPAHHWHIDPLRAYDTYACLSAHFATTPDEFFGVLMLKAEEAESSYKKEIQNIQLYRAQKHNEYIGQIPFSDFKVFDILSRKIKGAVNLQMSNSSAIRYLQLVDIDPSVSVFCNRGTSGIDGSTTTAIGAAVASDKPTVLVSGDISFFYDSNALWNNYIPENFKIVLINNGGGGIFRILPGHKETQTFNRYFETSHHLTAEYLAGMFGFQYQKAANEEEFEVALDKMFQQNTKPQIVEVFTPEKENDLILKEYFKKLL
ncbi:2-succinyl-5-enolpyruvyl-6-hydroxy-3-cyclohexene-1-carboxylic-acid synthase [Flavobacterium sp. NRK F10]|uniref:2-succinyl-5-enolpyruvyl-6-hydroxy-3- cyclohexene-1-carboxylic-acid synthase n=1 Tax=Flavobacterium sp. NRK F10 TaxID=2954931 RepID=UPI0020917551|nr:2-succinyl-5-enolpyruvyl-6-hydroxy-3-cyclohexene-1-carboxylic-acid synthase [Flavobacterium sp. NRK F10]MCO6175748.1 2-succinyl-5-enolpyruvyl-6-hydroxy-3-cyclohexene-1-carboxylic-acid synthase [Flavobacterium sp. NRK F10]